MISYRLILFLSKISLCCLLLFADAGLVTPNDEFQLSIKNLIFSNRGAKEVSTDNNSFVVLKDFIVPSVTTSTQWFNAIAYSDAACTANNVITYNSYVSGVCINYWHEAERSVKLSCINGGYATATYYNEYNCNSLATTSTFTTNTCTDLGIDNLSQKAYKYTCSVGVDTQWYVKKVDWFVFSGYSDPSCNTLVENVGMRNNFCFQKSLETSTKYEYPSVTTYWQSASCESFTDTDYKKFSLAGNGTTICVENKDSNTVAYGNYYAIRYIPSALVVSKDVSIVYTVHQVLSGITFSTYQAHSVAIQTVLSKVVATSMNGAESKNVHFLSPHKSATSAEEVIVVYTVTLPSVKAAGYISADEAYNLTTNQLRTAVRTGFCTSIMLSAAGSASLPVTVLWSAKCVIEPQYSEYSFVRVRKNEPSTARTTYATIIAVVVVLAIVLSIALCIVGCIRWWRTCNPKYGIVPVTYNTSTTIDIDMDIPYNHHQHHQQSTSVALAVSGNATTTSFGEEDLMDVTVVVLD